MDGTQGTEMYANTIGAQGEEAASAPLRPKRGGPGQRVNLIKHLSPRSILQVFLTVMALGKGVFFVFGY